MYVSCTSGNRYLRLLSLFLKVYLAGIMGFSVGFRGVCFFCCCCWSKQHTDS